jgi:hypothetical protein
MRRSPLLALVLVALGCATAPAAGSSGTCVLLAFDDGRVDGTVAFPHLNHEGVVRFELPPGEHRLQRLWLQAAGAGTLRWFIYDQTPLEGPGKVLRDGSIVIAARQVSNGKDGRWVYEDLSAMDGVTGVVWLGLRKAEGEPTIAASRVDSGQYFVRSLDPKSPTTGLMAVRRTPLVRLEIAP